MSSFLSNSCSLSPKNPGWFHPPVLSSCCPLSPSWKRRDSMENSYPCSFLCQARKNMRHFCSNPLVIMSRVSSVYLQEWWVQTVSAQRGEMQRGKRHCYIRSLQIITSRGNLACCLYLWIKFYWNTTCSFLFSFFFNVLSMAASVFWHRV